MNNRNILTKVSLAIAVATLLATTTIWEVRRVHAMPSGGFEDQARTLGMVGITRGQTMRLNVVNLVTLSDGQYPPDPCRVVLSFRNAQGQAIKNSDGQIIRRSVELQAGESAFLDLNGDMFGGPPPTNDTVAPLRVQLRPFVRVLQGPPEPERQYPPDPCRATMEVFDNASGRTSLFAAGFQPPPEGDRQQ